MKRELIFSCNKKDFEIQTFCTGGPGGQNQNRNQNGVRLVHKKTSLSAESRVHKSQAQNKKAAFRKLVKILVAHHMPDDIKERTTHKTESTRTYNKCTDRVKDHMTGDQFSYRQTVGKGDISEIIDARRNKQGGEL